MKIAIYHQKINSIIKRIFPNTFLKNIEFYSSGRMSLIYMLHIDNDTKFILKIQKNISEKFSQDFGKENIVKDYPFLKNFLPKIYYLDKSNKEIPSKFCILEYIEGEKLNFFSDLNLIYKIGEILGLFHQKTKIFMEKKEKKKIILEYFKKYISNIGSKVLKNKLMEILYNLLEKTNYNKCHISYIHHDFHAHNILITNEKKIKIIDWDSSRIGISEFDFIKLKHLNLYKYKYQTTEAFLEGYRQFNDLEFSPFIFLAELLWLIRMREFNRTYSLKKGDKYFLDEYYYKKNIKRLLKLLDKNRELILYDNKKIKEIFYPNVLEIHNEKIHDFEFNVIDDKEKYFIIKSKLEKIVGVPTSLVKCTKKSGDIILVKKECNGKLFFEVLDKKIILLIEDNKYSVFFNELIEYNQIYKGIYLFLAHIIQKKINFLGGLLIHSASILDANGIVTLLVGEKRSGKTTVFIEQCLKNNFFPLSVDKNYIFFNNKELEVKGFPSRLRILSGTLSKYEIFHSYIPTKYRNVTSEILWKGESEGKVSMSLHKFEEIINKKFGKGGKLKNIFFPEISKNNISEVKRIFDKKVILEKLKNSIYTPNNPEEDWWSLIGKENVKKVENNVKEILSLILKNCNFFVIKGSNHIENIYNYIGGI